MALITTKGIYGIIAMYELSKQSDKGSIQIKTISQKTSIPSSYLEQLLNTLKKAGFVESLRGAKGGYLLTQKAENIRIYDILVALEGKISFAEYSLDNKIFEIFSRDIDKKIEGILDANLSELQKYEDILNNCFTYII
jgi:Rrf2 family protein